MEVGRGEKRGLMKSKLVMSFYRADKPPSAVQCTAVAAVIKPRAATLVSFRHDGGKSEDGYVHGPNGGAGDEHVDNRATTYISQFKQRLLLEESNLINGIN